MKRMKSIMAAAVMMLALSVMVACKSGPSDAELTTSVKTATAATPGVNVSVDKGVVTLSGEVADDMAKSAAETSAKAVAGVKSVVNSITVKPVVINPDVALTTAVNAIVGAYNGVTADVMDGVITLRGEIKKADLPKLMEAVQGLNPKKVENQLSVK